MAIIFISSIATNEGKEISINWEGQSTDFPRDLWITIQLGEKKSRTLLNIRSSFVPLPPTPSWQSCSCHSDSHQTEPNWKPDRSHLKPDESVIKQHKYGIEAGKLKQTKDHKYQSKKLCTSRSRHLNFGWFWAISEPGSSCYIVKSAIFIIWVFWVICLH